MANNETNMNALYNVTNPNQTDAKKVLCVCSAGLLRSPTMANVLHQEFGFNTRAAGIREEYALIPVTDLLLAWADEIICMEKYQQVELEKRLNEAWDKHSINPITMPKVHCLKIPDRYQWNNPELRKIIRDQYLEKKDV